MQNDLIFDLGLHKGFDAIFYLSKGFRVVGVEALQIHCETVAKECARAVASQKLTIVQKALFERSGEEVTFYFTPEKDDWGSLFKGAAEKGVYQAQEVKVGTITLNDLYAAYGFPYYIKCDLEGGDAIFARQLAKSTYKPQFVSIEITAAEDLENLIVSGYKSFQFINQWSNPYTKAPSPAREGTYQNAHFTHEMSGLFGNELNPNGWVGISQAIRFLDSWLLLKQNAPDMVIGWMDVHARL